MQCPQCQTENKAGRKFCAACGQTLTLTCLQCAFVIEPDDRFCGGCGQALSPTAPTSDRLQAHTPVAYTPKHLADKILTTRSALEGERKQVTVLFADMVGFTALARDLDPEVVHEVMDHCFALLTAEVHRFEGTINQYTGDGIMALFGAPMAHEDSPRRAVHAALGMQRAMQNVGRELQAQRGFSLQMRIGMNTGLVVVGKIGDDLRMDYTAVGDTTNLAARLQQLAQPVTVVISEATHKLVAGYFETQDAGLHLLKGYAEPVRVFDVLRARGRRTRLEVAAERGLTPRVGRDRELTTLLDLFQQAKAGHGQVVSITGEACIGKSRLVLECRRALAAAGETFTWLEGQCLSFGQAIPFLPVIDQLRANFGIEEADGEPEIIAKIEDSMRRMGAIEAHIPAIRYLLAVDPGDAALSAMEPAARRKQLVDAVLALSLRGAQLRPLILVCEDLHWIDTSTEALLGTVLHRIAYYGQLLEAMPDAEEALRLARAVGEPKLLAQALSNLGATLQWRAEFGRGLAYLHEGAELAQRAHSGFDFGRAAFHIGIANTAKGEYEEALRWYRRISDNASAAGDKFFLARVPNCIGGVHLELFDLDEAIRLNLEGAEMAQQLWPWPEPRSHALLKVGLAHLERGVHGLAEEFFRGAWALLEEDTWLRWRWHIPLLRARGELALAEGRHDQAWTYATQSLELATQTDSRKHVVRAQRLQGEVLAASGRLDEAAQALAASVHLAGQLQTPREVWLGKAALGKVLARLGRDKEAEEQLTQATQTIEVIAANLQTPRLHHSFLSAAPVLEVYAALGHRPPSATL